jgi:prepilin-type N-terminal cleavage/methylation domain-containing protein
MKRPSLFPRHAEERAGFTLLEVLAAIFLTSIVITFAVSFYIDLANASRRALERTRESLRGTAVVARIARDLSNASFVVKAEEADPLSHPWFFVAESRVAFDGADLIKFNARSQSPGVNTAHRSDLTQVAYQVEETQDGSLNLYRWSAPGIPLGFEPGYPSIDDDRSFIVAEGLGSLALRFLDVEGNWLPGWDSTQLEASAELPVAVEIDVSIWREGELDDWNHQEERHFVRRVILRQRPIDLNAMIRERDEAAANAAAKNAPGGLGGGGGGDPNNPFGNLGDRDNPDFPGGQGEATPGSVAECTRRNWSLCVERYGEGNCGVWSNVTQVPVGAFGIDLPWCQF